MLAKSIKGISGVALAAAMMLSVPNVAQAVGDKAPTYATVKVEKLNVRASASKDSAVLGQLQRGDMVPVKKVKEGWVRLAWPTKSYVFQEGVELPAGSINRKPKYEDMREEFINRMRADDPTIQWLEVPRATGITVRYHWREYRDKDALVKRAKEMARIYSTMTHGENGIEVVIVSGNDTWAKAFY